jgi:hypothetical protein
MPGEGNRADAREEGVSLPFSRADFLDVFGRYNTAAWPVAALLWLATLAVLVVWTGSGRIDRRLLWGLLASQWACSGILYCLGFFRAINPAAVFFAILFLGQALLFAWRMGVEPALVVTTRGWRSVAGISLMGSALAYPFVQVALGMTYPRLPTFGVPCPTMLLTIGALLLAFSRPPVHLMIVPLLWTVVGGSASVLLGIPGDLALPLAGLVLLIAMLPEARPRRSGPLRGRVAGGPRSARPTGGILS